MFLPNIDSLFFSVNIKDYNTVAKPFLDGLEEKQIKAKETGSNAIVVIGDEAFELLPNGARIFKYILHNDKYELKFQQFHNHHGTNYPVFVRLKSEFLWHKKAGAYSHAIVLLNDYVGEVIAEKMSRADLCCHTDMIKVQKLKLDRFVTRANKKEEYIDEVEKLTTHKFKKYYTGKEITGLAFGKTPVHCRIYDKGLEIKQSSKKTWFYKIWKENGVEHDQVVNVEFQLNREFFKIYEIDSFEDFNNKIGAIWIYLTNKWLRYVKLDREKLERCTTEKHWSDLQKAYEKDWRQIAGIDRCVQKKSNSDHLLNMTRHYIVNYAASIECKDYEKIMETLKYKVDHILKSEYIDFAEVVETKMKLTR